MTEFFNAMESTERIYWYIAIGVSVIFLIQTVLTFMGADADTGGEADFDGNLGDTDQPFQLFSLRNLINFLLGFSWTGALLYNSISSKTIVAILATLVGLFLIAIFFVIMRSMHRLAEDNSFNIDATIGKTADVYLTIPAKKQGRGKVSVSVNGSLRELSAMTEDEEPLKSRAIVKVIDVKDGILIVSAAL